MVGVKYASLLDEGEKRNLITRDGANISFVSEANREKASFIEAGNKVSAEFLTTPPPSPKTSSSSTSSGADKTKDPFSNIFTGMREGAKYSFERFMKFGLVTKILNKFLATIKKVVQITKELDAA